VRYISVVGQLASTLLISLLLGVFIGLYLDRYFGTSPIFTIIVSFFGIFSGLISVVKMFSHIQKMEESKEKRDA
jgi:ATP synthase protein I